MLVGDMMQPDGRVFLKSEWAPIADRWPCVSYKRSNVGLKLRSEFQPGRDVLLYVGTTDPRHTEDPDHRSRLLSAVVVQPGQELETRKIIPPETWAASVALHGERWPFSVAVVRAAQLEGPPFPDARALIPEAYASLGEPRNFGSFVELVGEEREAARGLAAREVHLNLMPEVRAYIELRSTLTTPLAVRQEALRMAQGIIDRVNRGGELATRRNPVRIAPSFGDLVPLLVRKWTGTCALCGGPLFIGTDNPMLQASADRRDSANAAYDDANVQIAHLACNWAKNECADDQFDEWLAVVRGAEVE